ncbi:12278_t:CDS:1, partial [Racocetra persica]
PWGLRGKNEKLLDDFNDLITLVYYRKRYHENLITKRLMKSENSVKFMKFNDEIKEIKESIENIESIEHRIHGRHRIHGTTEIHQRCKLPYIMAIDKNKR